MMCNLIGYVNDSCKFFILAPLKISYTVFAYSAVIYLFVMFSVIEIYASKITRVVSQKVAFNARFNLSAALFLMNMFTLIPVSHWQRAPNYVSFITAWTTYLVSSSRHSICTSSVVIIILILVPIPIGTVPIRSYLRSTL